jgi:hypothetical protein
MLGILSYYYRVQSLHRYHDYNERNLYSYMGRLSIPVEQCMNLATAAFRPEMVSAAWWTVR